MALVEAEGPGPWQVGQQGPVRPGNCPAEKTADREEGRREEREAGTECSEETRGALGEAHRRAGPLPSGPETGEAACPG